MNTIEVLASTLRLKTEHDECGELIVPGKVGHIYLHDAGRHKFGLVLEDRANRSDPSGRRLPAKRRKALKAGFELYLDCDYEAILLFDGDDMNQSRLAARLVETKAKRRCTEVRLLQLRQDGTKTRFQTVRTLKKSSPPTALEGGFGTQEGPSLGKVRG